MNFEIISREEAKRQGLKRYFTGKPCVKGHISERYLRGDCVQCKLEQSAGWRKQNPDKHAEHSRRDYQKAKDERCGWQRAYNQERHRLHPEINREKNAARRSRTPPWADRKALRDFYKNCPKGHQVDHIIPLKGALISGLHVLENLQYLTEEENMRKGNKWSPEWDSNPQTPTFEEGRYT